MADRCVGVDVTSSNTRLGRGLGAGCVIYRHWDGNIVMDLQLDDVVRLRKPHPCGGHEWRITRLGADIGAICTTCGRRVMLPRAKFEKRVKQVVRRAAGPGDH